MGIPHVEASPLTRSSYHARQAAGRGRPTGRPAGRRGRARRRPAGRSVSTDAARVARLERVRRRMADLEVDALLLSLGADLPWLTGYEAMPLERLTMLVLPVDGAATLVVPRLEAPRVVEHPDVFALRPWSEHEDPVDIVARLVGAASPAGGLGPDLGHLRAGPAASPARLGLAPVVDGDRARCGRSRTPPRSRPWPRPRRPPTGWPSSCSPARSP